MTWFFFLLLTAAVRARILSLNKAQHAGFSCVQTHNFITGILARGAVIRSGMRRIKYSLAYAFLLYVTCRWLTIYLVLILFRAALGERRIAHNCKQRGNCALLSKTSCTAACISCSFCALLSAWDLTALIVWLRAMQIRSRQREI